jgi:hypothetical protein
VGPALYDVDRDGIADALLPCQDGTIRIVSGLQGGVILDLRAQPGVNTTPLLADIDVDGNLDIVAVVRGTGVEAHGLNRPAAPGREAWPGPRGGPSGTGCAK